MGSLGLIQREDFVQCWFSWKYLDLAGCHFTDKSANNSIIVPYLFFPLFIINLRYALHTRWQVIINLKACRKARKKEEKLSFLTFPADFWIPIIVSNFNYNCSTLLDMRNLQEQVKKAFCYQNFFWPFTVWINFVDFYHLRKKLPNEENSFISSLPSHFC